MSKGGRQKEIIILVLTMFVVLCHACSQSKSKQVETKQKASIPSNKVSHSVVTATQTDSLKGKSVKSVHYPPKAVTVIDSIRGEESKVVDVQAKFPGGDGEWRKYLERNLNRDLPIENGGPPGNYTVVVSFLVGKDGRISEVRAENNPGYGVEEEAIRIIRDGPKWIPALSKGEAVAYRQRQSFVVCLAEE